MKNIFLCLLGLCLFWGGSELSAQRQETVGQNIVLAYVTSGGKVLPDPAYVTHINYAFGHVDSTFSKVVIDRENRLREIVGLKSAAPHLKVLLSIGGWGSGNFSEMAADERCRSLFARDCKRVVDEFGLDGIDIDWEYPTSRAAGISASNADTENYTLLMHDIRQAIGADKLLTLASSASAKYIDFRAIDPYVDFVNIMTYDMGRPPYHHSALYRSSLVKRSFCEESVEAHLRQGVSIGKMVLGVPFYGHAAPPMSDFIDYRDIVKLEGYEACWDSVACVPYLADEKGNLVVTYENPRSLAIKCAYVRQKGLLGIMYWEYNTDDEEGSLRKAVYEGMKILSGENTKDVR